MRHSHSIFSFILFCCALAAPFTAAASDQPREVYPPEVYPPGVTVTVPKTVGDGTAFLCSFKTSSLVSVTVTFLGRSVTAPANESGEEAQVLLPVPLDHPDANVPLTWKATFTGPPGSAVMPGGGGEVIKIRKRAYPVQKLTVEPKYVTPDPALKERIDRERKLMTVALTTRSDVRHWNLPMARPVPGKITSLYGLRRVLNGQPRGAHRGLDFRGAAGSPIAAVAGGTVVLVGDFYYAGKCVVIDHGLGLVSVSMHMSETIAGQGQTVAAGDTIGLVGSTGRSTGPHLHLGISVLGQSVDALTLLQLTEEDKAAYAAAIKNVAAKPRRKPAARSTKPGTGGAGSKQVTR